MTHENSEGAAQVGDRDQAEPPVAERGSMSDETTDPMIRIDVEPALPALPAPTLDVPAGDASDSVPPMSRKLAPPPKPRRDSAAASRPPSARPPGEIPDPLTSSALKSPIAPSISYSSFPPASNAASDSSADAALSSVQPKPVAAPPRPTSVVPQALRPRSEPSAATPASSSPSSAAPAPVAPASVAPASSSSAIFAMRIIAVGDPMRPAPVPAESAGDVDANAYPPSASRLGTGVRRSSRPKLAVMLPPEVPTDTPPLAEVQGALAAPEMRPRATEVGAPGSASQTMKVSLPEAAPPEIDVSLPEAAPPEIDVSLPEAALPEIDVSLPEAALEIALPRSSPLAVALPHDEGAEELSDEDVSPDSNAKKAAATDFDEFGRDEAISVPPEELAAFQAEAKTDPGKPPPPPKRAATAPPLEANQAGAAASASATPPTPDLAAAKAAQRKNARAPWWEDLFSEDFMRATARVSDEQIRREVTFIEESLGVAAGGVVLDLGCGTGHHAVEFASRGYGVVGYDLSLYQLALAADVAQERSQKINFLQGDMREMAFEEMFDGVFCWNTTFGYFEEDKNLAVAQRVFKALRPGGMFLIDVLNRDFAAASAPCTVWYEGDSCVCMDDMSVDYISSRLRVKRSIILDDGRTKESLFSLRLYSLHELGKLLHEVGFRVTEASGHPATPGVFFGPNSPRIIMLAQRP